MILIWGFEFWIGLVSFLYLATLHGAVWILDLGFAIFAKICILHKIYVNHKPRRFKSADILLSQWLLIGRQFQALVESRPFKISSRFSRRQVLDC